MTTKAFIQASINFNLECTLRGILGLIDRSCSVTPVSVQSYGECFTVSILGYEVKGFELYQALDQALTSLKGRVDLGYWFEDLDSIDIDSNPFDSTIMVKLIY